MKHLWLTILFLFIGDIIMGQYLRPTNLNTNSEVIFISGNEYVVSQTNNSLVSVNANYNKKEITFHVICQNKTSQPINVDAVNLFVTGENSIGEKIRLKVYSYDEYVQILVKKANTAAVWDAIAVGLDQGLNQKTQTQKTNELIALESRSDQYQKNAEQKASLLLKNTTLLKFDEEVEGQVKIQGDKKYSQKIYLYVPVGTETHEICYTLSRIKPKYEKRIKTIEENYYNNGLTKLNAENYDGAISDFSKYIELKPNDSQGYFSRAYCKRMKNEYENALIDYEKALQLDPIDVNTWIERGTTNTLMENYQGAINDYTQVIKLQPDSVIGYFYRGTVEFKLNEYDKAIKDYNKVIEIKPNNLFAYYFKANAELENGNVENAISNYSEIIQFNPDFVEGYYRRAILNYKNHGLSLAIPDFQKVIELEDNLGKYTWKPFALHYIGKDDDALTLMKQIVSENNQAGDYYNLACIYSLQNDVKNGIEALSIALEKGYNDFNWILKDEDMENLKYTDAFSSLLLNYGIENKFNLQEYVQKYVEKNIIIWQQKGKYEKSASYLTRVNEETRTEEIEKLKEEATLSFKQNYLLGVDWNNMSIEGYDADAETFRVTQEKFGEFFINIPIVDAEYFENNYRSFIYDDAEILFNDKGITLSYLTIKNTQNNKIWTYDITKQVNFSPKEFILNFDKVNADLPSFDIGKINNYEVSYVNIGKSDVDIKIPETMISNSKTFAVIIGNENYKNEIKVNFAVNDAITFYKYAIKTLGIPENQVHLIKDATFGQMLEELKWLSDITKAYEGTAQIIFYYAGHGMPDEKTKNAYILPTDGNSTIIQTAINTDDLYAQLTEYPSSSVTVFLDACFSGAARDGMLTEGRGVKIEPKSNILNGNLVVFSATSGDETAYPYKDKNHGLFTYFLLKKLKETKGKATYQELYNYIKKNVTQQSIIINKKLQVPKINISNKLTDSWKTLKLID